MIRCEGRSTSIQLRIFAKVRAPSFCFSPTLSEIKFPNTDCSIPLVASANTSESSQELRVKTFSSSCGIQIRRLTMRKLTLLEVGNNKECNFPHAHLVF